MFTNYEESQPALPSPVSSCVTASTRPSGEGVAATSNQICGKMCCSTTWTAYHRLQHRRNSFDEVASIRVESLNKSAIARVKRVAWNTSFAGRKEQPPGIADSIIEQ